MTLLPGQRLGPYEIVAPIGAGGMGDVYRAHDTRLKRDVALKVLPPDVAADAARRQRFELEARASAALNHPNIVAIYDVGEAHEVYFLVTELVDGATLRGIKPSLRKTVDYGVQLANGLAAAHAAGIVHRDLKPENILLTRDGRIKILDFGLAKLTAAAPALAEMATVGAGTGPGVVLGTVGYMSPEQVRGEAADHRSDIFSFGVILHELIGGQRAFQGNTSVETMNAILKHDPPELPDATPSGIRQVIAHCLEKDPDNRFQSARDLAFALGAISQSGSHPSVATTALRSSAWRRRAIAAAAGLLLVAATVVITKIVSSTPEAPSWTGGMLGGPETALAPRVSPDGHLLAFEAFERGITQVAVMRPETGNWSILTHSREAGSVIGLCWSSDGGSIYYDRILDVPHGIYSVPVLGGEEKLILENALLPEALGDGTLAVLRLNGKRQFQLFRFWPETGRLQGLPIANPTIFSPFFSARAVGDGKRIVTHGFVVGHENEGQRLVIVDLTTGDVRPLLAYGEPDIIPGAGGVVTRDRQFFVTAMPAGALTRIVAVPLSAASSARTLFTVADGIWNLDAAADGSIYASLVTRPGQVVRRSVDGSVSERIAALPLGLTDSIAVLPDGRLVTTIQASGKSRLVVVDAGKDPAPLIATAEETSTPAAVVGGRQIAFTIGTPPSQTIALAETATGRITSRVSPGKGEIQSIGASPDGRTLYFAAGQTIWSIPTDGGQAKPLRAGDSVVVDPSGRSLIVNVVENEKLRFFRVFLDGRPEQEIVTDRSAPIMGWSMTPGALNPDGQLLVPLQDAWFNRPAILDTGSGRLTHIPSDDASDYHSMAWLPDGRIMALHIGVRAALWKFQTR